MRSKTAGKSRMNRSDNVKYASYFLNRGKNILCVDDNINDYKLLFKDFHRYGFAVDNACDANTALSMLKSGKKYDFVSIDKNLPGMDGRDLFFRIEEEFKIMDVTRPHIIFLTGHPSEKDAKELIQTGAKAFVRKEDVLNPENKGKLAYLMEDIERGDKWNHGWDVNSILVLGNEYRRIHPLIEELTQRKISAYFHTCESKPYSITKEYVTDLMRRAESKPESIVLDENIERVLKTIEKNYIRVVAFDGQAPVMKQLINFFFPYVGVIENASRSTNPTESADNIEYVASNWKTTLKKLRSDKPPKLILVSGESCTAKTTEQDMAVRKIDPHTREVVNYSSRGPRLFEVNGHGKLFVDDLYFPARNDEFAVYFKHKDGKSILGIKKNDITNPYINNITPVITLPDPSALKLMKKEYPDAKIVLFRAESEVLKRRRDCRGEWDDFGDWQDGCASLESILAEKKKFDEIDLQVDLTIKTVNSDSYIYRLLVAKKLANFMHESRFGTSIDSATKYFDSNPTQSGL